MPMDKPIKPQTDLKQLEVCLSSRTLRVWTTVLPLLMRVTLMPLSIPQNILATGSKVKTKWDPKSLVRKCQKEMSKNGSPYRV